MSDEAKNPSAKGGAEACPDDGRRMPSWLLDLSSYDRWTYHDGEWWETLNWLIINRGRGGEAWTHSFAPDPSRWKTATTPNGKVAEEDHHGIAISEVDGRPFVVLRGYPFDAAGVRTVERQFPRCKWRVSAVGIAYAEVNGRHVATVMRRGDES